MKKIYLTIAASLMAAGLIAQAPLNVEPIPVTQVKPMNKKINKTYREMVPVTSTSSSNRVTVISEYISAIDLVTDWWGTSGSRFIGVTNPVFPDSNIMVGFTTPSAPWFHAINQTIDLGGIHATDAGAVFDPLVQPFSPNEPFNLDSIEIGSIYWRFDNSVVDTALVSIYARDNGNLDNSIYFTNPDSAKAVLLEGDKTDLVGDGALTTIKVILDSAFFADSLSNGTHVIRAFPNLTIPGVHEGVFSVSVAFIPGKTGYSQATDTIWENANAIGIIFSTPLGQDAAFPVGHGSDNTVGSFFDGLNTKYGTLNYWPIAPQFVGSHPYQLYDVNAKITQTNNATRSIDESESSATLFQNYPNPATGFTTVKYALENQSNVSFEMIDVTGKKVISSLEGNKNAGVHTIEINTNDLNAGIYFYSLVVNGQTITKKMTITK